MKGKAKKTLRRSIRWAGHAARDVHAWVVSVITIVAGALAQFLAGLDPAAFLAMPPKEKALRVLVAVGPGVLLHIATARQHQDADAIVAKLKAKGVQIVEPDPPAAGAPPATPPSAGS